MATYNGLGFDGTNKLQSFHHQQTVLMFPA